jgi:hypothetical protein
MREPEYRKVFAASVARPQSYGESNTLVVRKSKARSRISNGKEVLPGIDGRSALARRYRDITAALIADMGGVARMSEARMQLCRRFAAQSVQAENLEARLAMGEPVSIAEHSLLSSTLVRLAARLGIERRAHKIVPDLGEYLDAKAKIVEHEKADAS